MKVVKKGIGYKVTCGKCSSILEVKRKEIDTEEKIRRQGETSCLWRIHKDLDRRTLGRDNPLQECHPSV